MNKPFLYLALALAALTLTGLLFANTTHLVTAQDTNVTGIISQNTTWTKTNSPYTLTGPVGVSSGVTLTVEAGTTVNLGKYYILLNGTLRAQGSSTDKICFIGDNGRISFTQYSPSWDEQTRSGSIIENTIITSAEVTIGNTAPKINNNSINGNIRITDGSPLISNHNIVAAGSGSNAIAGGTPLIIDNIIKGGIGVDDSTVIINNIIEGEGQEYGIYAGSNAFISENTIYGFQTGIRAYLEEIIEKNLIINNYNGILMCINANPTILNNTIANNSRGITLPGYSGGSLITYHNIQVNYNNIYNNTNYNVYLGFDGGPARDNVTATYNWWGTTDAAAINQSIYDFKNDFNLGNVTFVPFLTSPNPQATPNSNAPLPTLTPSTTLTASPTQTPSPTPSTPPTHSATSSPSPTPTLTPTLSSSPSPSSAVPEFPSWLVALLVFAATLTVIALKKKQRNN